MRDVVSNVQCAINIKIKINIISPIKRCWWCSPARAPQRDTEDDLDVSGIRFTHANMLGTGTGHGSSRVGTKEWPSSYARIEMDLRLKYLK